MYHLNRAANRSSCSEAVAPEADSTVLMVPSFELSLTSLKARHACVSLGLTCSPVAFGAARDQVALVRPEAPAGACLRPRQSTCSAETCASPGHSGCLLLLLVATAPLRYQWLRSVWRVESLAAA